MKIQKFFYFSNDDGIPPLSFLLVSIYFSDLFGAFSISDRNPFQAGVANRTTRGKRNGSMFLSHSYDILCIGMAKDKSRLVFAQTKRLLSADIFRCENSTKNFSRSISFSRSRPSRSLNGHDLFRGSDVQKPTVLSYSREKASPVGHKKSLQKQGTSNFPPDKRTGKKGSFSANREASPCRRADEAVLFFILLLRMKV